MSPVFRHGGLRLYLLKLLDEAPRHGYEVIRLLQDRFMGVYAPSPGTIYPRLARLEEEGLVTHDEVDGKKVYRITDKGRAEINSRLDDLAELEEELTQSVRDIAREVTEDVRDTVRNLREELTWATKDVRREQREQAREAARERAQAGQGRGQGERQAGQGRGQARQPARRRRRDRPAATRPGRPVTRLREQAKRDREDARRDREDAGHQREAGQGRYRDWVRLGLVAGLAELAAVGGGWRGRGGRSWPAALRARPGDVPRPGTGGRRFRPGAAQGRRGTPSPSARTPSATCGPSSRTR